MVAALTPAEGPLAGRCIWYTRPQDVDGELPRRCRALGATVWWAPALAIAPLPATHPALIAARTTLQQQFEHVVFISTNAVRYGLPLLRARWPDWPAGSACYAIGAATARQLSEHGIAARQPLGGAADSEALLQLPPLQHVAGQGVLIVRGLGGRQALAQALSARGARVACIEAYERRAVPEHRIEANRRLAAKTFDFITASSGETVENIVNLIDDSVRRQLLAAAIVVPGERVGARARELGFTRVVLALNAGDEAMTEAILETVAGIAASGRDEEFQ